MINIQLSQLEKRVIASYCKHLNANKFQPSGLMFDIVYLVAQYVDWVGISSENPTKAQLNKTENIRQALSGTLHQWRVVRGW